MKSATAGVEFMDYVGDGQTIRLAPGDVLVLSYLKSCEHETITGGTVTVGRGAQRGARRPNRPGKVPCDGGKMQLSAQQASASAASAFRLQSADVQLALYARTPVVQFPRILASEDRTLLIERTDRQGERHEFKIDDAIAAAGFYDLAKINVSLTPGAIYEATIGGHKMTFQVDANAEFRSGADRQPPAALPIAPSGRRAPMDPVRLRAAAAGASDCTRRRSRRRLTRARRVAGLLDRRADHAALARFR